MSLRFLFKASGSFYLKQVDFPITEIMKSSFDRAGRMGAEFRTC